MADNIVDNLEVRVSASAQSANAQLELLCKKLSKVQTALADAQNGGLRQMAGGVAQLATAMNGFSNTKTTEFTRLAKNLNQIANVNAAGIRNTASAIQSMNAQLAGMSGVNFNVTGLAELATAIGRLGGSYVTQASANLPILRQALVSFIQALNGLGTIRFDISGMAMLTTSLATLGKTAATNAVTNIPLLATALRNMMATLATAPVVSENLIRMTNALAGLAAQGNKIPSVYNRVTKSQDKYTASAKKANKASTSLAAKIGRLYATYFLLSRAVKAIWGSVTSATDYIETLNYFDVTVNKVANEAASSWKKNGYESADAYYASFRERMTELTKKFTGFEVTEDNLVLTNVASLGMNVNDILNYQANYLQLADSMGVVEETAYNVSSALTMLGGDWASLKNLDVDVSMKKLSSALVGQTRAVRELGIDTLQATLQEYAYKYGIDDSVNSMTQAAKVQLRVLAILDQSKVAYGDLARTISQPANMMRVLSANVQNLGRTIGSLLVPIVSSALPVINGFVLAMNRLFTSLGNMLGVDWTKSITSIGGGLEEDAEGMGGLGDEIEGTTKAAEKFNKTIRGWDELELLNKKEDSGGGAGGASAGGYDELDTAIADALGEYRKAWDEAFSGMDTSANGFADKISGGFSKIKEAAGPTLTAVKKLWDEGLSKFGGFAYDTIKGFYDECLVKFGTWMLSDEAGLPRFLSITNDLLNNVPWDKLKTSIEKLYTPLNKIKKLTWTAIMDFYEYCLKPLGTWTLGEGIPALAETAAQLLDDVDWETLGAGIKSFATGLGKFAIGVGDGFVGFITGIAPVATTAVNKFITALALVDWEALGTGAGELAKGLLDFGKDIANGFIGFMGSVLGWVGKGIAKFLNALGPAMGALGEGLQKMPDSIGEGIGAALGGIFSALALIKTVTLAKSLGSLIGTMAKKIPALFAGIAAHPYAAIAVAVGALFSALAYFNETPADKAAEALKELMEAADEVSESTEKMKDENQESVESVNKNYDSVEEMAEKFYELSKNYDKLTDGEKELLAFYSDELKNALPGIEDYIDVVTKAYQGTYDTLQKLIEKQREYYLLQAYQGNIKNAYSTKANTEKELDEAQEVLDEKKQNFSNAKEKYYGQLREQWDKFQKDWPNDTFKVYGTSKGMQYAQTFEELKKIYDFEITLPTGDMFLRSNNGFGSSDNFYQSYLEYYNAADAVNTIKQNLKEADDEILYWEGKIIEHSLTLPDVSVSSQNLVDTLSDPFKDFDSEVTTSISSALTDVEDLLKNSKEPIGDEAKALKKKIQKAIKPIEKTLPKYMKNAIADMLQAIEDGKPGATTKMEALANAIKAAAAGKNAPLSIETWQTIGKNLLKAIADTITPEGIQKALFEKGIVIPGFTAEEIATVLSGEGNNVTKEIQEEAERNGENTGEGCANGIEESTDKVVIANKKLAKAGEKGYRDENLIKSPSKVYEQLGKYEVQGLIKGLDSEKLSLLTSMTEISDEMQKAFKPQFKLNVPDFSTTFAPPQLNMSAVQTASINAAVDFTESLAEKLVPHLDRIVKEIANNRPIINNSADPNAIIKTTVEANKKNINMTGRSLYEY